MTLDERILKYLSTVPPAVSGSGGHNQTFAIACRLYNGFALTDGELLHYLSIYNQTCQPPWSEKELIHKVRQAASAAHNEARGHLLGATNGNGHLPAKAIVAEKKQDMPDPLWCVEQFLGSFRCFEADVSARSPLFAETFDLEPSTFVSTLFRPGESVNYVTDFELYQNKKSGQTKATPSGIGKIVPSETFSSWFAKNRLPKSDAGCWIRINPVNGGVKDENVTAFRYVLLEFDNLPLDLQLSFFARLPLPIAVIMTSGGKSLHAWVKVDCLDEIDYADTVAMMLKHLAPFGLDAKNKNPSRLSRLPGATRVIGAAGDGRQRLIYLNPNPTGEPIL